MCRWALNDDEERGLKAEDEWCDEDEKVGRHFMGDDVGVQTE